ncbi:MAG: ATP-binding protein, partial [Parachlamydia sp.]|nr:ATP-binding protein [Parachlamydia sp.]
PSTYRRLRQLLFHYLFNALSHIEMYNNQQLYRSLNWPVYFSMMGKLLDPAVTQMTGEQQLTLFADSLNKISCFLDLFGRLKGSSATEVMANYLKPEKKQEFFRNQKIASSIQRIPPEMETNWSDWVTACGALFKYQTVLQDLAQSSTEKKQEAWCAVFSELEKLHLIHDEIRPWIYALYLSDSEPELAGQDFALPLFASEEQNLHQDSDLTHFYGSSDTARQRIQSARLQHVPSPIGELLKNAKEARSPSMDVNIYQTQNQESAAVFRDTGCGMGEEEFKAFKTPGRTTKRRCIEDPNYGQGVYGVFAPGEYTGMTVRSRKADQADGKAMQMTLAGDGIKLKRKETEEMTQGSEIILTRKWRFGPLLDSLIFRSDLLKAARYQEGIEISFNGKPLVKSGHNPALSLTTHYTDQQGLQQEVLGEAVKGKGSVYVKGNPMGDIPEEYLRWVPPCLQEIFKKQAINFSLFLTAVDQVMGRSQAVVDPFSVSAIQHLILRLSCKALLNEWINNQQLSMLSEDFWDLKYANVYTMTLRARQLTEAVLNESNAASLRSFDKVNEEKAALFEAVKAYLDRVDPEHLPTQGREGILKQLASQMEDTPSVLKDRNSIITALLHSPRPGSALMLQEMRRQLRNLVCAQGIVVKGKYSQEWLKAHENDLEEAISAILTPLFSDYPSTLHPLLRQFEKNLITQLAGCRAQKTQIVQNAAPPCPQLETFLKRVAKNIYGKQIQIRTYCKADNTLAKAEGRDLVWVNLAGRVVPFHRLVADFQNHTANDELLKRYTPLIVQWLDTLAHELTHLEDLSACDSTGETHDPQFYEKMAKKLERLFDPASDVPPALQLLLEVLNEGQDMANQDVPMSD